jgi:transcription elongation factor Elf1
MENNPSPNPSPKWEIPDSWAKNGRCPACGATNLKVTHLPDLADYLSCAKCEIAFEVENGGRYIRLKYVPDALEFVDAVLHNRWVEASKISEIISEKRAQIQEKKTPAPPPIIFSEEDVWSRALRMYRMGNKPKMIQLMLLQSGLTQEQADAVFAKLKKISEREAQQQNRKFWTVAGISIFLFVLAACSWIYVSGNLPILLGITTVTPAPSQMANQPSAVSMLLNLIPKDAKPSLMKLPDTRVVEHHGPGPSACPATPITAAELFGGEAALWTRDESRFPAWQMISSGDSVTVNVPDGMTAAYVDNKSFKLLSVHGPATIYNANFLAITCD